MEKNTSNLLKPKIKDIKINLKLLSALNLVKSSYLHLPIIILLFNSITDSMTLTMALVSTEAFTTSLLNIPTGIMADRVGRKKTMILASIFDVLPAIIYIFAFIYNAIPLLFIGALFQGFARSLYKGTSTSLLYETLYTLGKKEDYYKVYGIIKVFWQIGILISVLATSALGSISFLYGLLFICVYKTLGIIINLFLVESPYIKNIISEKFTKNSLKTSFKHFMVAFKKLISNRKLLTLNIVDIVDHIAENITHNLQNIYFKMLVPIWMVGILKALKHFFGATGFWFAKNIINYFGSLKSYKGSILISSFFQFIALFISSIISPFIMVMQNLFFGVSNTVSSALTQEEYSNRERVTMASISSFAKTIIFGLGSLGFGYIADLHGIVTSLYILAGVKFTVWIILKTTKSFN